MLNPSVFTSGCRRILYGSSSEWLLTIHSDWKRRNSAWDQFTWVNSVIYRFEWSFEAIYVENGRPNLRTHHDSPRVLLFSDPASVGYNTNGYYPVFRTPCIAFYRPNLRASDRPRQSKTDVRWTVVNRTIRSKFELVWNKKCSTWYTDGVHLFTQKDMWSRFLVITCSIWIRLSVPRGLHELIWRLK